MAEICRGLLIKEKWLNRIFAKEKLWEIRNSPTSIRGRIFLIQSGSGLVVGECSIIDCIILDKRTFEDGRTFHTIESSYESLGYSHPYAWIIEKASIKRYNCPVQYQHPSGAIIWVNLNKCCDYMKLLDL